jgi:hypothetical protein
MTKPWVLNGIATNKSFEFKDFEIMMKYRKSTNAVVDFHTVTSKIVGKYKSYFKREFRNINSHSGYIGSVPKNILMEAINDYPDIFLTRLLLVECKDFDLSKCTESDQNLIVSAISSKRLRDYVGINHLWNYVSFIDSSYPLHIFTHSEHITVDVLNTYLKPYLQKFTTGWYLHSMMKQSEEVLEYLIDNGYMPDKKPHITTILENRRVTWKFIKKHADMFTSENDVWTTLV